MRRTDEEDEEDEDEEDESYGHDDYDVYKMIPSKWKPCKGKTTGKKSMQPFLTSIPTDSGREAGSPGSINLQVGLAIRFAPT